MGPYRCFEPQLVRPGQAIRHYSRAPLPICSRTGSTSTLGLESRQKFRIPAYFYGLARLGACSSTRLANRPPNLEELTHLCVVALQVYYDGKCPEECLEARARDFAAWHLARLGHDPPAGQRE